MKRTLSYILLFALLGGTSLFAYNNGGVKSNVQEKWGRYTAKDSDGPLKSEARITVDVDYPGEYRWPLGIKYNAYAKVTAGFAWSSEGNYYLTANANGTSRYANNTWNMWAYRSISSDSSDTSDSDNDLQNMNANDVREELRKCSARGNIIQDPNEDAYYGEGDDGYQSIAHIPLGSTYY